MSLSKDFSNKVVLVTGSSSGIGETTAILFAKLGAKLVVTGRDESRVNETAAKCEEVSPHKLKPLKVVGDFGRDEVIVNLMDTIIENYNQLDVLVNNAGMGFDRDGDPLEAFDAVHKVNLRAVYQICLRALPLLEKSKGVVINNSSICGLKPFPDSLPYCVSKAGLDMMTRCLALDWGPKGIRVNSINPGQIQTPIFARYIGFSEQELQVMWNKISEKYPLRRFGLTEDIAKAIVFLASDDSSFITGIQLKIDGGFLDSPELIWK